MPSHILGLSSEVNEAAIHIPQTTEKGVALTLRIPAHWPPSPRSFSTGSPIRAMSRFHVFAVAVGVQVREIRRAVGGQAAALGPGVGNQRAGAESGGRLSPARSTTLKGWWQTAGSVWTGLRDGVGMQAA